MARDDLHFRLRIPEDLKRRIEDAAGRNRRSMTAEIVDRLENSFYAMRTINRPDLPPEFIDTTEHIAILKNALAMTEDQLRKAGTAFHHLQRQVNELVEAKVGLSHDDPEGDN